MSFSVYLPPQATSGPVPVLYWLGGLECTDENFITKAGAQAWAAEAGLMLVAPDTSPRGAGVPGEDDDWTFGTGAGFYVNATEPGFRDHYRMYDYVVSELPALVEKHFPATERRSVAGHSMGGHGALVVALRNPDRYRTASAFAPVSSPTRCPWGRRAFRGYLGEDETEWARYDASLLVASVSSQRCPPLLVDQGMDDPFREEQLRPDLLEAACAAADHPLELRRHDGYDHSYHFVASFMRDHIRHAVK